MQPSIQRAAFAAIVLCLGACSDPKAEQLRRTTLATYDQTTGRLKQLTFGDNKNGVIDTWTEMDAARPVFTKQDRTEDGKTDRWESYDAWC